MTVPFAMVTLATLAYFTALGALLPTLPKYIKDDLGGGGFAVGLSVGIFSIAAAVLRPWAGRLGDRRGRRILIVGGAAIVGLSVISYSLFDNLAYLVVMRIVTGVGEAAVFVGAATAVQDMSPDDRRGEAASYFSVALYAGLALGPTMGEHLVDWFGYHTTWTCVGGLSLLAAVAGLKTPVGETSDHKPDTILNRAALRPGIVLFLGMIPFAGFAAFIAIYAEKIGIDDVGPIFATSAVSVLLVRLFGARLPDQLGWRVASTVALGAATLAALLFAVWASTIGIYVATVALAVGQSLLFPALFTAVVDDAPESQRSHAVGTFSVFFDLSGGLGAPMLGLVISLWNERGAFAVAALFAALGFLALQSLRASHSARSTATVACSQRETVVPPML